MRRYRDGRERCETYDRASGCLYLVSVWSQHVVPALYVVRTVQHPSWWHSLPADARDVARFPRSGTPNWTWLPPLVAFAIDGLRSGTNDPWRARATGMCTPMFDHSARILGRPPETLSVLRSPDPATVIGRCSVLTHRRRS
jgi:hypothetical protein